MSYENLVEIKLPELISNSGVSHILAGKVAMLLMKLESLDIVCPGYIDANDDNDVALHWFYKSGDWTQSLVDQNRYYWAITIMISDHKDKEEDCDRDCFFVSTDCRNGVRNNPKYNLLYFNYDDQIPKEVLKVLIEFEDFIRIIK